MTWSAALVGLVLALAGCDGSPGTHADPPAPSSEWANSRDLAAGQFVGQCGSLADADVSATSGVADLHLVSSNPLRCHWQAPAGAAVTFEWFRGSPLTTHVPDDSGAAKTPVTVAQHAGFSWQGAHTCEVAVESGGGDFISWSVAAPATSCAAAEQLTAVTLQKVAG